MPRCNVACGSSWFHSAMAATRVSKKRAISQSVSPRATR